MKFLLLMVVAVGCATAKPQRDVYMTALTRKPSAEVRAALHSTDPQQRLRATVAAGRLQDPAALEELTAMLTESRLMGNAAAWSLSRIEGGQPALIKCVDELCPGAGVAARNLTDVDALLRALRGPAAQLAALQLGVLARSKIAFPGNTAALLAAAAAELRKDGLEDGPVYALSRLPRSSAPEIQPALLAAFESRDAWTRSLAARAWGRHGLPANKLPLRDADLGVRIEAARALATAADARLEFHGTEALGIDLLSESPHVVITLLESAAALKVLAPAPELFQHPAVRCAAAQSRDRVRKQLIDTPACESGWHGRARTGALAAELELQVEARKAFADEDGRVRGAAAGAAGAVFAEDLRTLLQDADPYVVQQAAQSLAKDSGSREAALAAVHRLAPAHLKPSGDPAGDALIALLAITGPVPELLPTPNTALALALGMHGVPAPLPPELFREARRLRIHTKAGELVVILHNNVAPITSAAISALAKRGFYDGLDFHRVVPDFVIQGGDPRGDGDGGPGWSVPDELSPLSFIRGTMGIATNGPETGGSQFFFCNSPQPHLDGRYVVAGELTPESLPVMDLIQPGDKIISATAE
ncbi:MAG TPA: peptidylprolyl isomerase [Myxococcales bacterium]|nr:peptidylprolyl isomerase [Myxococcales bacterium]